MKKLTASLASGFLIAAGVLFVSNASPATAGPYTGTVETTHTITVSKAVVAKGGSNTITVKVAPAAGTGVAKGTVKIAVIKKNADRKSKVTFVKTTALKKGKARLVLKSLSRRGKYRVATFYTPKAGSVWIASKGKKINAFVVK